MYFRHLVLAACLLLLSGCGIIDYFFLPPPEDTAQELYEGANDAMQEKNYSQAAQYYTKLKDNFPFSPYTVEAELSLGDAFFLDGKSGDRRGLRLCRRPGHYDAGLYRVFVQQYIFGVHFYEPFL